MATHFTQNREVQRRAHWQRFLCWQFANKLLFFERVCSPRLQFWTAHWSDRIVKNKYFTEQPKAYNLTAPALILYHKDGQSCSTSAWRHDRSRSRVSCLSVSAVPSLDGAIKESRVSVDGTKELEGNSILTLTLDWREWEASRYRQLYSRRKNVWYPLIGREGRWTSEQEWPGGEGNTCLLQAGIEQRIVQSVGRSVLTLWCLTTYIHKSYRTANLQTLHFKYLLNKYTYWIF